MQRLFIAISLPEDVLDALQCITPGAQRGIRPTSRQQMHLTLHFLGEMETELVKTTLEGVDHQPFSLTINSVGRFSGRERTTILWAGINPSQPLLDLHQSLTDALQGIGYQPEARPYNPHITLARCNAMADREAIQHFLKKHDDFRIEDVPVNDFMLYSSVLEKAGPVYAVEGVFALKN